LLIACLGLDRAPDTPQAFGSRAGLAPELGLVPTGAVKTPDARHVGGLGVAVVGVLHLAALSLQGAAVGSAQGAVVEHVVREGLKTGRVRAVSVDVGDEHRLRN